jgi:hypothetical protein
MYQVTKGEFMQYEAAEEQWLRLRRLHRLELVEAYACIHPTRSCFDYDAGKIYSESVNPADYAVYLADLQAEQKKSEEWWYSRAGLYCEAVKRLSPEEHAILKAENDFRQVRSVKNKLRGILSEMIAERPDLQRASSFIADELESMEEADELIGEMSEEELLEDYIDFIEKEYSPPKFSGNLIPLEQKKEMNISPVAEWTMSEAERVDYVAKHPIIKRSRKHYDYRWLG